MTQTFHQFQTKVDNYQRQHGLTGVPFSTRLVISQLVGSILKVAEVEKVSFIIIGTVGVTSAWDQPVLIQYS
jgi:hypothetical protein